MKTQFISGQSTIALRATHPVTVLALGWVILLSQPAMSQDSVAAKCPLQLSVTVVTAVEAGPFVVAIALTNRSRDKYDFWYTHSQGFSIKVPDEWRVRARTDVIGGSVEEDAYEPVTLAEGESYRHLRYISLHRDYEGIEAGELKIPCTFTVHQGGRSPADKDAVKHVLSHELKVSVRKRSPETTRWLLSDLLDRVKKAKSPDEFQVLAACIDDTSIRELSPVAIEIMRRDNAVGASLLPWFFNGLSIDDACFQVCTTFSSAKMALAEPALRHWRTYVGRGVLADKHYKRLRQAPSIWIRLATLLHFPEGFTAAQMDELLQQAATIMVDLPEKEIASLVRVLDDDSFAKREDASSRLILMGARALPTLAKLARNAPSAEADLRIANVIKAIRGLSPDPEEVRVVSAARSMSDPSKNGRPILEALAKNSTSANLTQMAKKALSDLDTPALPRRK